MIKEEISKMPEIEQSRKNIIIARLIAVLIAMLAIYIILGICWAITRQS